jgi:hypothetical protein
MLGFLRVKSKMQRKIGELRKKLKAGTATMEDFHEIKKMARKIYVMPSAGGPGGWGNIITWRGNTDKTINQWTIMKVVGFKGERPRVDDILMSKLHSGKVCMFVFTEVEYMSNPADGFFGTVMTLGYDPHSTGIERER